MATPVPTLTLTFDLGTVTGSGTLLERLATVSLCNTVAGCNGLLGAVGPDGTYSATKFIRCGFAGIDLYLQTTTESGQSRGLETYSPHVS